RARNSEGWATTRTTPSRPGSAPRRAGPATRRPRPTCDAARARLQRSGSRWAWRAWRQAARPTTPCQRGRRVAMLGAMTPRIIRPDVFEVAYEEHGPSGGAPVILLHGFPYDPRAYDEVAPPLAADGRRVLVPYLRGYGPTRFLLPDTPRSGQQAALGHD